MPHMLRLKRNYGACPMPIDYSKYPPNWKTEIVPRIIDRANNCCEFCGVNNGAKLWSIPMRLRELGKYKIRQLWIESDYDMERIRRNFTLAGDIKQITVVLTIAHLDHDEENHDIADDRLAALCQQCHCTYDAKEKQRRIVEKAGL